MEFRDKIKNTFVERKKRNPLYSLRALAQYLEVDQSLLSKILKGQRQPSVEVVHKVCQKLGIESSQVKTFLAQKNTEVSYDELKYEAYQLLAHWEHFAILELIKTKNFKPSILWISKRLDLSQLEIETAVKRLEQFGYIKRVTPKKWILTKPNLSWVNYSETSAPKSFYQKKLLELAKQSIDKTNFLMRENSSLTIQCSTKIIPKIKQEIDDFQNKLNKLIESQGPHDEVYQLVVGFFPLTHIGDKK